MRKIRWLDRMLARSRRERRADLAKIVRLSNGDPVALGVVLRDRGWSKRSMAMEVLTGVVGWLFGGILGAMMMLALVEMEFQSLSFGRDFGTFAGSWFCSSVQAETGEVSVSCRFPKGWLP